VIKAHAAMSASLSDLGVPNPSESLCGQARRLRSGFRLIDNGLRGASRILKAARGVEFLAAEAQRMNDAAIGYMALAYLLRRRPAVLVRVVQLSEIWSLLLGSVPLGAILGIGLFRRSRDLAIARCALSMMRRSLTLSGTFSGSSILHRTCCTIERELCPSTIHRFW
jgi:hypothetical protein